MTTLNVWLESFDQPIGTLWSAEDNRLAFAYSMEWRSHPSAFPISQSLPLAAEGSAAFDRNVRPYFENLIPEDRDLIDDIRKRAGIDDDNDLCALLAVIGSDVAGALSCTPLQDPQPKSPGQLGEHYEAISEEEIVDIVARLGERKPLPDHIIDKSGVAGFQRKYPCVQLADGSFMRPRPGTGAPTTHIVKVPYLDPDRSRPNPTIPREALLEATCATLARTCGLDTAWSSSRWIGQYEAVISERFDRVVTPDGWIHRVHQEDFAQALGLLPRQKYERYATPTRRFSAETSAGLIRSLGNPAQAAAAFLKTAFFNIAIGNADNHAKNHAILYVPGAAPILAPLYDLVPTRLNSQIDERFGFMIGTADRSEKVTRKDCMSFLSCFGYEGARAERFITNEVLPMFSKLLVAIERTEIQWLEDCGFANLARNSSARLVELLSLT